MLFSLLRSSSFVIRVAMRSKELHTQDIPFVKRSVSKSKIVFVMEIEWIRGRVKQPPFGRSPLEILFSEEKLLTFVLPREFLPLC